MSDAKPLERHSSAGDIADVQHAPFIYFENAPALSHVNGLIRITVSADTVLLRDGNPIAQQVAVAYLRTNMQGARSLIDALQGALLLAAPTEETKN